MPAMLSEARTLPRTRRAAYNVLLRGERTQLAIAIVLFCSFGLNVIAVTPTWL